MAEDCLNFGYKRINQEDLPLKNSADHINQKDLSLKNQTRNLLEDFVESGKDYDFYYHRYNELVESFIEAYKYNNYSDLDIILEETLAFLNKYSEINDQDIAQQIVNKMLLEIFDKEKPDEKRIKKITNICHKEIGKIFHFASCYSRYYTLGDIGERIEKFMIFPEYLGYSNDLKEIIRDIFIFGFIKQTEIKKEYLELLIYDGFVSIDNKKRINLTAKGVNLVRTFREVESEKEIISNNPNKVWLSIRTRY